MCVSKAGDRFLAVGMEGGLMSLQRRQKEDQFLKQKASMFPVARVKMDGVNNLLAELFFIELSCSATLVVFVCLYDCLPVDLFGWLVGWLSFTVLPTAHCCYCWFVLFPYGLIRCSF